MNLTFYKYQGTGNDFVMIDNRTKIFPKNNTDKISQICDRHFGIGADGIILIENDADYDFKMIYFNADGSQTFCGNGGRCAVAFAKYLNIIKNKTTFLAYDGKHYAEINDGIISLHMIDVDEIIVKENSVFAYTGTQHHVEMVDELDDYPVFANGKKIRYSYDDPGSNVNFAQQINENTFRVRTYEKGVEDETLACGTGVTAVAIAMHKTNKTKSNSISLPVEGGILQVSFTENDGVYTNVFLKGPAEFVFEGNISL
ncbi:diaminopimelate epimerase [Polaribacter reichenbachii]|uniref:Diaminopimelate epimerase n=1 Tax=Polaribacter reichenbachii TaxID=996801 RepID=A0A1B8U5U4_9FLAO|nr:diaminopimelate epimerase [Polaribacter reichenbachii]APZ47830.1 diaminopimelate epimerase [Polaribacter reichenbachii]AUC18465.1 diaminopimelate epimerase [Polaribacter reichenbachii]OBY67222.1 diaminopimelate epimerase [Polaribacter reichenbachii]